MELSSPPKPTRMVDSLMQDPVEEATSRLTEKTTTREDSLGEEAEETSELEAVSLPDLAGEVAVAQRQQINELSQRQEVLERLKENCYQVELKINSAKSDLAAVSRKVYLTEDEVSKKKAWCEKLEREIAVLVGSESKLTRELAIANDKLERDRQLYRQYRAKMAAHLQQVALYERDHPIYKSEAEQKARSAKLSEALERLQRSLGDESKFRKSQQVELSRRKRTQETVGEIIGFIQDARGGQSAGTTQLRDCNTAEAKQSPVDKDGASVGKIISAAQSILERRSLSIT